MTDAWHKGSGWTGDIMRTFLVTGGAGFIGSHLAEALVRRGDKVRVIDNLSTGFLANLDPIFDAIEFVEGDITDPDAVAEAVRGVDCVFHEAALASVPRSMERPLDTHAACVTGTITLLDAARRAGVRRVVYAGSSSAYGDQPASSKRETDPPMPISPYGAAKLAGEFYCQAFAASFPIETVTLRYFNVFGPRQDPGSPYAAVIPLFITAILAGRQPVIYGDGQQSRDFTYVANVVHANLLAADAPGVSGRVFNVANGRTVTLLELLAALNRLLGTDVAPIHAPPRPGDIRESMADITLARKCLGYEPQVDFLEGLRRSIDAYRAAAGLHRSTAGQPS
jgi:UDP-glucose 4-epimerase